jgi:hypothetical protein
MPDSRRGRTISPRARGAKQTTHHGRLQRLLDRTAAQCNPIGRRSEEHRNGNNAKRADDVDRGTHRRQGTNEVVGNANEGKEPHEKRSCRWRSYASVGRVRLAPGEQEDRVRKKRGRRCDPKIDVVAHQVRLKRPHRSGKSQNRQDQGGRPAHVRSNAKVEGPYTSALWRRGRTISQRPRRQTDRASRPLPTFVRGRHL